MAERKERMNKNPRCDFCLKKDREVYINSPVRNKRRVYICAGCVEMCTFILLEKKYEMVGKQKGGDDAEI